MTLTLFEHTGDFAEDKDVAAALRNDFVEPALAKNKSITLDFSEIYLTTQSFVHALISAPLRQHGEEALKRMSFKGCAPLVQGIVETVVQYSLETLDE